MVNCVFLNSVSKIDKISNCSGICMHCSIIDRYNKLVTLNKIDVVEDMMNVRIRSNKHRNNKNKKED